MTTRPAVSLASTLTAAAAGSAWASATVKVREASSVALPTVPEYAFSVTVSVTRFLSLAGGVIAAVKDWSVSRRVTEISMASVVLSASSV